MAQDRVKTQASDRGINVKGGIVQAQRRTQLGEKTRDHGGLVRGQVSGSVLGRGLVLDGPPRPEQPPQWLERAFSPTGHQRSHTDRSGTHGLLMQGSCVSSSLWAVNTGAIHPREPLLKRCVYSFRASGSECIPCTEAPGGLPDSQPSAQTENQGTCHIPGCPCPAQGCTLVQPTLAVCFFRCVLGKPDQSPSLASPQCSVWP